MTPRVARPGFLRQVQSNKPNPQHETRVQVDPSGKNQQPRNDPPAISLTIEFQKPKQKRRQEKRIHLRPHRRKKTEMQQKDCQWSTNGEQPKIRTAPPGTRNTGP